MSQKTKGTLEDALKELLIQDMSGGLVTTTGAFALASNQTPDSLNVFGYQGQLYFRGGYSKFSTVAAAADAAVTYIDASGDTHMVIWANGNMYDVASGSPSTIATGVYTPGQNIAKAQLGSVLYWATITVPLRQYNGTTEQAVSNSGGTGVVAPPACNFLLSYAGSLVALYPFPSGVPQKSSFMWCNVNDPTTWLGVNIQTVGTNDGGVVTFGLEMGIVPGGVINTGIPSTRQLIIGKSYAAASKFVQQTQTLYMYQGALGSLTENAIPCATGAADVASAVYIPTGQGLGICCFLGSDGQVWQTNGSTAQPISIPNISTLVYALYKNALAANSAQRFNAVYNDHYQYYLLDFGSGQQLAYKWDTGAWWLFSGWPSGPYLIANASNGLSAIFVAANQSGVVNGVYQIAIDQTNDNGSNINAYWTTPYLHGGQPHREKIFENVTIYTQNVGVQYTVSGQSIPRADGSVLTTQPLVFNDPATNSTPAVGTGIWDVSEWDSGAVWGGGYSSLVMPYPIVANRGRLNILSTLSKWMPAGQPGPFRTGAALLKVAWSGGVSDFKLTAFGVGLLYRSTGFVGNQPNSTEGNYNPSAPNKFTNTGNAGNQ